MCKSESIEVYEVTKETAKELQLGNMKRKKLDIEIDLEAENNYFKITSDKYVPFSNLSIEQQYLKYLIQDEVKKLCEKNKGEEKILLASYQGETPKNADVENMLLYNIGAGAFAEFFSDQKTQRLAFWLESPQDKEHNTYCYKYEIADSPDDNDKLPQKIESGFKTNELATWTDISIDDTLPKRPDEYYFALRRNHNKDKIDPLHSIGYEGAFGLKITLTVPKANTSSHPVSVVKHLLDGVICAFHGEAGKAKAAVEDRFKNQLDKLSKELQLDKLPKELLEKSLKDSDGFNVLGKREYLKKNAGWNPADEADRLKFAYIIVKHKNTEKKYEMSGAVYKASPKE